MDAPPTAKLSADLKLAYLRQLADALPPADASALATRAARLVALPPLVDARALGRGESAAGKMDELAATAAPNPRDPPDPDGEGKEGKEGKSA